MSDKIAMARFRSEGTNHQIPGYISTSTGTIYTIQNSLKLIPPSVLKKFHVQLSPKSVANSNSTSAPTPTIHVSIRSFLTNKKLPRRFEFPSVFFFMETARNIIPRPVLCFPGTRIATHRLSLPPNGLGTGKCGIPFRSKRYDGILSRGFSDSGHLKYYVSPARCGVKKEKSKKKQLKLMRRLSRDLPIFSHAVCGEEGNGSLIGEVKEKMISEATEILLAELQNRRLERKEQKRKRREERATLIKNRPRCDSGSSSSSSSSSSGSSSPESSDSDCSREVVSMKQMRSNALNPFIEIESANAIKEEATQEDQHRDTVSGAKSNDSSPQNLSDGAQIGASGRKVEICMGGKCRKLGAAALLEEFERKIGMESTVVGCKCMGKCKKGPNVRVFNCTVENKDMRVEDSIKPPLNLSMHRSWFEGCGYHWSSTSGQ